MTRKPFFPNGITGQRAWLVNYKAMIAIVGPLLGLTAAQITAEQNACQLMINEIDATDAIITASTAKVAERNALIKSQMGILRPAISIMKNNVAYTEALGTQLDIIGAEQVIDTATAKTIVKLSRVPQGVDIKFGLEHCEGGNIYSMRGSETTFTLLKAITHPHTIDTRPNLVAGGPETRQYYVTLLMDDSEIGIPSAAEAINI